VPPHCDAVVGAQPVVSGRELGPPPPKCGPGLVATPLGPLVHWPLLHRPLAHAAASAQALPLEIPPGELPLPGPEGEPFVLVLPHPKAAKTLNESAIAASVE